MFFLCFCRTQHFRWVWSFGMFLSNHALDYSTNNLFQSASFQFYGFEMRVKSWCHSLAWCCFRTGHSRCQTLLNRINFANRHFDLVLPFFRTRSPTPSRAYSLRPYWSNFWNTLFFPSIFQHKWLDQSDKWHS